MRRIRQGVTDIETLFLEDTPGRFEGVGIITQFQHLYENIGITLSLIRPESYVTIVESITQTALENIRRNDGLVASLNREMSLHEAEI